VKCVICASEVHNAFACVDCRIDMLNLICRAGITYERQDGTTVLCLLDELDLVMSRQARGAERVGGRGSERPLPFDARASRAHSNLSHILAKWARTYHMETGSGAPRAAARFLARQRLEQKPDVLWIHVELTNAVNAASAVIDLPPSRLYIGVCSAPRNGLVYCHAELYADEGQKQVTCYQCKTVHSVTERRAVLMTAVEDVLATATDIARAVHLFQEPLKAATIYQWKNRGRIEVRGYNEKGGPLYRVGDVLTLVRDNARDNGLTADGLSDKLS
jgi:hypothetical protein